MRAGLTGDQVDYVFMGQVLQAGAGQIGARQAAVHGGIPMTVPASTINKVCLSGLNTIHLADQMIQQGEADIVVAGGMESMTQAPYLLPGARAGYRIGDQKVVDSMMYDGLFCAFDQVAMGAGTEKYAASAGLAREPQDELAAKSPRARRPRRQGRPVRQRDRQGGDPAAQGRPGGVRHRRGRARRDHRRVARRAPPRLRQGRQHHRRQRLADLRRRRRGDRRLQGGGREARRQPARRGRRLRPGRRSRPVAAHPAVAAPSTRRSSGPASP